MKCMVWLGEGLFAVGIICVYCRYSANYSANPAGVDLSESERVASTSIMN